MTTPVEVQPSHTNDGVDERSQTLKEDIDMVERADTTNSVDTMPVRLSKGHRDYLIERHGTLDLDPLPGVSPADPLNWSAWKKMLNLVLVAFHALMGTFMASAIIPAYSDITQKLGVSMQQASYLTSLQIAVLGGAPLFWKPLSNRFGRRPIFLLSLICSLVCNVGCAKSPDYASTAACRALAAFFISPASAIGSAVVMETTFKRDRARYMGVWTLMVTLGVPSGPFIFGFVAYRAGYQWIYWVLAMINGGQFILYLLFGPETRYVGSCADRQESNWKTEYVHVRRIDPTPLTWYEFIRPLTLLSRPSIAIPAAAYAMVFLFANILATVEIPNLLEAKFKLNAEQVGLQFLSSIIGAVIGEQLGGIMSDFWMNHRERRTGQKPHPEYRLWLSYFGFALAIIGLIVFLVCTQTSPAGHWNVTPIVGVAIGAAGNQVITTVLVTYAIDCYPEEAASIGVCITFVRQIWGFLGPFWFPSMFASVGVAASSGIGAGLMVGVSAVPTLLVHWKGRSWRKVRQDTTI